MNTTSTPLPCVNDAGQHHYMFTIFTPSYNRADVLPMVYSSIREQSYRDFEWLVIDDGSTDDTEEVVKTFQTKANFPIIFHRQENQGKHIAHNTALGYARGFLFITLDAGDTLLPHALERIKQHWDAIPEELKNRFAGVAGRCLNEDGSLSGEPYSRDIIDSDYLEIFRFNRMNGERREALRTDILRQYPYPKIDGERHIRPTLILRRMAHCYKIRFTNEPLEINRHETDGITANRFSYRMNNPRGLRLHFLEEINLHDIYTPKKNLFRHCARYVRYSLHSGIGFIRQGRDIKHKLLWLLAIPQGSMEWLADNIKKVSGKKHTHASR